MRRQFWEWVADHCPRKLVYFCAVRLGAHATTGPYSDQVVPDLTLTDALKRWNEKETDRAIERARQEQRR